MIRQLIIASCLALLASVVEAASPQHVFLFSNDGSYKRLNLADGQSSQGSLKEFGFHEVFKVVGDSANRRVLVLASRYPTKATREEPTKTSLVVLGEDGKLLRTISKPIEPGDAVNVLADPQGKTIALSVYNAARKRKAVFILDAQDFKTISTVEGVFLGQHATYSYDGLRISASADGVTPLVSQVDVSAARKRIYPLRSMGSASYFSKGLLAIRDSKALIVENKTDPQVRLQRRVFIYDLKQERITGDIDLNIKGDYVLLPKANAVVALEGTYPTQVEQQQTQATSSLHVFSTESGARIKTLSLPRGGRIAGISSDEKSLYYVAPGSISLIDLQQLKVTAEIKIPPSQDKLAVVVER